MQQKLFNYQHMVLAIVNAVREEAKALSGPVNPGQIKISIVPMTMEADEMLGGLSYDTKIISGKTVEDFATYSYSYALDPEKGIDANINGSYITIYVKKRNLVSGKDDDNLSGCVYVWNDFMEVTVRVSGADSKDKILAQLAYDAVVPFFDERTPDFSIKLEK